jgi:hypothetical protein
VEKNYKYLIAKGLDLNSAVEKAVEKKPFPVEPVENSGGWAEFSTGSTGHPQAVFHRSVENCPKSISMN